jgi:hypothetical protein
MSDSKQTMVDWDYPRIGTCGEPCDILRVSLCRVRAVPDLLLKFDGVRNGWVVGGSFRTADGYDFEFKEVAFIPEDDLDEDRFTNAAGQPPAAGR